MSEKKIKTKDMVIAVFCTILAILCIVFYFLPAFTVKHRASPSSDYEVVNYSAWEMTQAVFTDTKVIGSNMEGLLYIKETYGFAIILSGILMPLGIICTIVTTVFSYLSWLKNTNFKKYCFLFSLCGMMFTTVTLIATWFIAIQIRDGNNFGFFNYNLKGSIAYASFVSLILAFVVAIIACAYNYFLDNFDDEEEEDDDEDEDDEEEEEIKPKKLKKVTSEEVKEKAKETVAVDNTKKPTTRTTSKPRTTAAKPITKKSTTTKSSTAKKTASK